MCRVTLKAPSDVACVVMQSNRSSAMHAACHEQFFPEDGEQALNTM